MVAGAEAPTYDAAPAPFKPALFKTLEAVPMLSTIRKQSSGIVVKILLFLLILSFAAWGIADVFSPSADDTPVASVGDRDIPANAVAGEIQREMARLAPLLGGTVSREQARGLGIPNAVIRRMVERTLFDVGAQDLGLTVSDPEARRNIEANKTFFNQFGRFDRFIFDQVLQQNGLSENSYVATLRADLARDQLFSAVRGASASDALVRLLYKARMERRVAETVTLKNAAINKVAEPSVETLKTFHKENPGPFTAPEFRKLTVVKLNATELAPEIAVSQDDIKAAYDDRQAEFFKPEERELEQILLKTEDGATKAANALKAGGDFMVVAKDAGMDPKAVPLGKRTHDEMTEELAGPAFALAEGSVTAPTKTAFGWHLIRTVKITPERKQTLADVGEKLKKEIQNERAVDALYSLSNQLEDTLGGGATLEEASQSLNLKRVNVAAVDANGRDRSGKLIPDVAERVLLQAAFALPQGEESVLTETGSDGYFIVRVDEVTPPTLKPFDAIEKEVRAAYVADARSKKTETAAKDIVEKLKSGSDFAALAAQEHGTNVITTPAFTRTGDGLKGIELSRAAIAGLFNAKLGDTFFDKTNDGVVVVRLTRVVGADPTANAEALAKMKEEAKTAMQNDLIAGLAIGLGQRYPVTINRRILDQIF